MTTSHPPVPDTVDVAVVGAGPAGSAAAATLARAGRSVALLEAHPFPRFHIGESLLPPVNALFEQLGVAERVAEAGFVRKHGAEFSGPSGRFGRVPFAEQSPDRHHATYQVERAQLDDLLLDHARSCGAHVAQPAAVQDVLLDDDRVTGVRYRCGREDRVLRAAVTVDAGGRGSRIARTFDLRRSVERLRMVAVYRHFDGLDEVHNPSVEGDIQIGSHDEGWVWAIPIAPDVLSVGAVMPREVLRAGTAPTVFADHVARLPRITERLRGTSPRGEVRVETDYCYYADEVSGPGWFLAGDAAAFADPMFSGGALLAMATGIRAAHGADAIVRDPAAAPGVRASYDRFLKTGYDAYARLVQAYYDYDHQLARYFTEVGVPIPDGRLAGNEWVVRLLSGDFWAAENPLLDLMRSRARWDTFAPFAPLRECPFYAPPRPGSPDAYA